MNNSVDVNSLFEYLEQLKDLSTKSSEFYTNFLYHFNLFSENYKTLLGYNGFLAEITDHSSVFDTATGQQYVCFKEKRWEIKANNEFHKIFAELSRLQEISIFSENLNDFIAELNKSESIAGFIETEINKLTNTLALTEEGIAAFDTLKTNIFLDEYNASRNTNSVTISDEKVQYWTDEPLEFKYDPKTGSYLILQGGIGMGWTNKDGILEYYKALKDNQPKEEVVEEKPVEEKEEVIEEKPVEEKVDKEKTIDKEIVVVPKEVHHYVEAREDIIVPEGKILTGIGYRNALEGEVLHYNEDKNKYYSSDGGMGFSLEKLANGKFTDK